MLLSGFHPQNQFRYLPSANPYCAKIRGFAPWAFTDEDTEQFRGKWVSEFGGERIMVEIGCNGGHVLNEWALRNPRDHYVGIDWKFKQIFRGAEKAVKRGIKNVTFLRANAVRLAHIFATGEVDELAIFFPDPWPKRAQTRNRLLSADWFKCVAPLLKPGGRILFKTDHREYFESVLNALSEDADCPFRAEGVNFDKHAQNPNAAMLGFPAVTLFEKLFIKDGLPICEATFLLKTSS